MKYRFVEHEDDWYLIPANEIDGFTDLSYEETCAEDEFREDGDETAARKWSDARRIFRDTYGKYRIEVHLSRYVFENPQIKDELLDSPDDASNIEVAKQ